MSEITKEVKGKKVTETIPNPAPAPFKAPEAPKTPPMRQVVIETDGDRINLLKAEVSGRIELIGILQSLISFLNTPKQQ